MIDGADRHESNLADRVRSAVFWRSGAQIVAQVISWGTTLLVVRLLTPADYGLFAMTSVILAFMTFMNGLQFASALVQAESLDPIRVRQTFGLVLMLGIALALAQVALAPLAALYYRQPLVAAMLRWQSLIYLAAPIAAIPEVMLARALDFRRTALVNLTAALVGAGVSLGAALAGAGVWTLVVAPIALFWTRAIGLTLATKTLVRPIFNFAGTRGIWGFGLALLVSQGFWLVQSQSDILIAGRRFDPHALGLYAEAVFLTSIFAAKFVPPLNEVAFPAYARIRAETGSLAKAFVNSVALIMAIACPFYVGLALLAGPAIALLLGARWAAMAPLVATLALAMPMMTLHILFAPAVNAAGRPDISARNAACGAAIMPLTYLVAVHWGAPGLTIGWIIAYPLLLACTYVQAREVLEIRLSTLAYAIWPGLSGALVMAAVLWPLRRTLSMLPPVATLALFVPLGAAVYAGVLWRWHRPLLDQVLALVTRRPAR